jgi:predicted DNA-binding transcriptional regulator YafY
MAKKDSINRYNLIINKVRKYPCTFKEVISFLEEQSDMQGIDLTISKRTFQRDLEDIRTIFNIDIQFDYSRKVYYIVEEGVPEYNDRILEAFDTFNALNITDRISNFINFENRRPKGTENLYGLVHAIKNKFKISYTYYKFWNETPTERIVEPFALKEFKNRWYLIAKDDKDERIKIFALDRLSDLNISSRHFKNDDTYNVENHFKYCFGIITPDDLTDEPEEIILSFKPFQGKYIKSLPLHSTQKVLIDNDKELRISLTLHITFDFVMELISLAENLTVIQPESLKREIKNKLTKTLENY